MKIWYTQILKCKEGQQLVKGWYKSQQAHLHLLNILTW